MLEPWRTGKVIKIEDATASTRRFWIEIPELTSFDFKPGQFITLDLPIHEKKNKRWRSYSIASAPDGTNIVELVIVLLEDGAGTNYLFKEVKEGTELTLRGPQGVFTLPEHLDKDLFLICTGTGIAPFRSMAHHIHQHKIPHQNIHIIFGCRKHGDCLYGPELKQLEKDEPGFYYHPVFSREESVPEGAHKGYVHGVYEELLRIQKTPAYFYLCGWKNMIDEAKQRIIALGYDKKDIHLELYG
jgi:CDP-4-dehydro-6-deoxyglucose reductase